MHFWLFIKLLKDRGIFLHIKWWSLKCPFQRYQNSKKTDEIFLHWPLLELSHPIDYIQPDIINPKWVPNKCRLQWTLNLILITTHMIQVISTELMGLVWKPNSAMQHQSGKVYSFWLHKRPFHKRNYIFCFFDRPIRVTKTLSRIKILHVDWLIHKSKWHNLIVNRPSGKKQKE